MAGQPRLVVGRSGIALTKDPASVIEIMKNIPGLCDDEVIMSGGEVSSALVGDDNPCASQGLRSLGEACAMQ
jgi:hypothetical protein